MFFPDESSLDGPTPGYRRDPTPGYRRDPTLGYKRDPTPSYRRDPTPSYRRDPLKAYWPCLLEYYLLQKISFESYRILETTEMKCSKC